MRGFSRMATITAIAAGIALAPCAARTASAASGRELQQDGRAALQDLYAKQPSAKLLGSKAKAILVFPSIVKAGFMFGGQIGEGIRLENGKFKGYYSSVAASYGLQAGSGGVIGVPGSGGRSTVPGSAGMGTTSGGTGTTSGGMGTTSGSGRAGQNSESGGATGAGGDTDAGGNPSVDGGLPAECNGAAEGMPCGQAALTNCAPPCDPDPCEACAVLRCEPSGTWERSYLPKAVCLQCGAGLHCLQETNFCRITGPAPSTTAKYECSPIPAGCTGDNKTCACLEAANPGYACTVFDGDFTLKKQ